MALNILAFMISSIHYVLNLFQLRTNKSYILKTAAWQNLKETNPALVTEVMEEVLLDDCDSPPLKRKCDYVMFFERNGIISRLRFSDLNQSS